MLKIKSERGHTPHNLLPGFKGFHGKMGRMTDVDVGLSPWIEQVVRRASGTVTNGKPQLNYTPGMRTEDSRINLALYSSFIIVPTCCNFAKNNSVPRIWGHEVWRTRGNFGTLMLYYACMTASTQRSSPIFPDNKLSTTLQVQIFSNVSPAKKAVVFYNWPRAFF